MKSGFKKLTTIIGLLLLLPLTQLYAQVRLPYLISDGMVLQRDCKLNLWGWAAPGEKVSLTFIGKQYKTTAQQNGKWSIVTGPIKPGGPFTMTIKASNNIEINNILIGDVWFCSGQSNMVLPMERVREKYPDEIATADYPEIRNFFIPTVSDVTHPNDNLPAAKWVEASEGNIAQFGAASWFFAKQLYHKYHIPIGIINSSVGGTPIQAWISTEGIGQIQPYTSRIEQFKQANFAATALNPVPEKTGKQADLGLTETKKWFDTSYVPKQWHHFWLPGYWADQGIKNLNGVVWFRKEVNIPASITNKPAKLYMGRIVDADEVYVNGTLIGNTTYQYPPRRYTIPPTLLKPGKNLIVVRVTNTAGKGGFVPDKNYFITAETKNIDLRGDWQYKVGQVLEPADNAKYAPQFSAQNEPTGLYNTMVAPATNYKLKGFVWYQGEANTGKPTEYEQLLTALINDWRNKWNQGNLPFIYAQLPNFMEVQYSPSESQWALLREAQLKVLSVANTAMAVTIDAGEWNDIHPLDKKDVGERLALTAQKLAYGDNQVVSSGPLYQSASKQGDKIIITFTNTGSGLVIKDGDKLAQFALAGKDKKFKWAKAIIKGNTVVVWNEDITGPMYVRYAWADNPDGANLYNAEGLPASPFRTDD